MTLEKETPGEGLPGETASITRLYHSSITGLGAGQVSLVRCLGRKASRFKRKDDAIHSAWLRQNGWQYLGPDGYDRLSNSRVFWRRPDQSVADWTMLEAIDQCAEHVAGERLRALGWYCPHRIGLWCATSKICRAPGTWEGNGRTKRGSGGKPMSLRAALRLAGIDLALTQGGGS